jgi:hypothetical protein
MDRIKTMRSASYLLPAPGGEVVRGLLDELTQTREEVKEAEAYSRGLVRTYEKAEAKVKELDKKLSLEGVKNNSNVARVEFLEGKVLNVEADSKRLNIAMEILFIGSCNCDTKTNDAEYHKEYCRYRLAKLALIYTEGDKEES